MQRLKELAHWVARRNEADQELARILGRPAEKGHLGEFIAATVFDIELEASATKAGHDGRFRAGTLAGRTVNVKLYGAQEGILDINPEFLPDYFLCLTGQTKSPGSSRGSVRPLSTDQVFLFDAHLLVRALSTRGVKIGTATSIRKTLWAEALIYPGGDSNLAREFLTPERAEALAWFTTTAIPLPDIIGNPR